MKGKSLIYFSLLLGLFIFGCDDTVIESEEQVDNQEETSNNNIESKDDVSEEKEVSFYGVGDNLIHSEIFDYAHVGDGNYDFKPIYENVRTDIESADLSFINQESILGGDYRGFSGYPAFNTPSDMAEDLVDLDFNLINGANNHTLDMGIEGVLNNLEYWEEYADREDIIYTGMYESPEDRDEIPVIEKNGITFSLLSYTYGTNGIEPDTDYRLNYFDPELIEEDVTRAQEVSDFVLVSAHWGDEDVHYPNEMQQDYAQLFADLEVDAVIGHHTHTIQPVEWVTGKNGNETLVVYSLGNFLAATVSDFKLLSGSIQFDVVQKEDEYHIDNVLWEPLVIHYEEEIPDEIKTRTNFEIYKLDEYPEEKAEQHAVNNYDEYEITIEKFEELTEEVVPSEFLE